MSHFPKPFYRPRRQRWYVQLAGKQINLGAEREAAFARYHELMIEARRSGARPQAVAARPELVVEVIEKFLGWVQQHRAPDTYEWYRYRLQRFAEQHATLTVADLRAFHVQEWVDQYPLSQTSRRNYLRTMKRCLHWAVRQGYVDRSPLEQLEIPAGEHRETSVSEEEYADLLAVVRDESFRDLLVVTWESGCRPQESLRVEARHVDPVHRRWVFPKAESKTKKNVRVVYLTPSAWEIVQRLVALYPNGPLFRNSQGASWTTEAVNCAFRRLRERIGRSRAQTAVMEIPEAELQAFAATLKKERMVAGKPRRKTNGELRQEARKKLRQRRACQLVPKYSLYALRHAWATRALKNGVDPLTTAILMGHSDPSMLAKVYQHLALHPDHLREQACRAGH